MSMGSEEGKPPRTDPDTWRVSRIPQDDTITQTNAQKFYHLQPGDLQSLDYNLCSVLVHGSSGWISTNAHRYQEREVERKAWEKHGGPEVLEYMQNRTKARMARVRGDEDPRTPNNDLRRLKRQFIPWVWDICNQKLGRPGDKANAWGKSKDRLRALKLALPRFKHYPSRPVTRLPPSTSVNALREPLRRAPRPNRNASGRIIPSPGVRIFMPDLECTPDEEIYSWDERYLDGLFDALNAVIDQHGLGDEGWKSIRWEVYDTFCVMFEGIGWNREGDGSLVWSDMGAEWLSGKVDEQQRQQLKARGCRSGRSYNDKLAVLLLNSGQ